MSPFWYDLIILRWIWFGRIQWLNILYGIIWSNSTLHSLRKFLALVSLVLNIESKYLIFRDRISRCSHGMEGYSFTILTLKSFHLSLLSISVPCQQEQLCWTVLTLCCFQFFVLWHFWNSYPHWSKLMSSQSSPVSKRKIFSFTQLPISAIRKALRLLRYYEISWPWQS